ncbi:MAG TPA: methyltransferase domain-containing protein [Alphaproteobacteria bacterium]
MDPSHYRLDEELAERHWWWVARRNILASLVAHAIAPAGDARQILEVGCSTGSNLALLGRFGTVTGLEMHAPTAERCRARHPGTEVLCAAIPAPLARRFDAICAFDVLEHIGDERGAVDWLADHLKRPGQLFVAVPAFAFLWSRHDNLAHHRRRYTRAGLARALAPRFDVTYATYFNFHLFPAIAAVRLAQRALGVGSGRDDKRVGGGWANGLLRAVFDAERLWLPRVPLPVGVSLFMAATAR